MNRKYAAELRPATNALLVGNSQHGEFRDAVRWLGEHTRAVFVPDAQAAFEHLARPHRLPQLIVLAQARPGELPAQMIEQLHAAAPLARLVSLLGSLCEGEVRSGQPWPGVLRVYWHQWNARCDAELLPLMRGECSSWSLPRTAAPAEEALHVSRRAIPRRQGLVVIRAPREIEYEALADVCGLLGASTIWLPPQRTANVQRADLLVWDSDGCRAHELDRLRDLANQLKPARVLALLGFPRREDVVQARAAGADRILSKPHLLGDLLVCLSDLLPPAEADDCIRSSPSW